MIDKKTLKVLEFDKVLGLLANFTVSNRAKKVISQIQPENEFFSVEKSLCLTQEAFDVYYKYCLNPLSSFDEVDEVLNKARIGAVLQMGELLKVGRLLKSSRIAKKVIMNCDKELPNLKQISSNLYTNLELEENIDNSIASDTEMRDEASEKLRTIRRKLIATNNKLKDKLSSYTRTSEASKFLQDNIVTVRNGRFVLPVKAEYKSSIGGLVHDQSSSGSTVFIEPFIIVEMNNELRALMGDEQAEIDRILQVFSSEVSNIHEMLYYTQENITMLDIVFSKSKFSSSYNGIKPILNRKTSVKILKGRHVLLEKNSVVPTDIALGDTYRFLLITGPNTGGKTVSLKTLGLFCLMTYCGLLLPCEEGSEICVYDNIFCDIGDEQSIELSLSTFSSHIKNIEEITNKITQNSLVLFDELGVGTDPTEGAALAIGILKYLEKINCSAVITTHYSELKEYALINKNMMNASMQFNEETLSPTFRLIMGLPGASNALKIAKKLGVNDYIITKSYENLSQDKVMFETVLAEAEAIKNKALHEYDILQQEKARIESERLIINLERKKIEQRLERINNDAKIETKKIVRNSVEKAEEIIEEISALINYANEASLLEAKRLRTKLNNIQYEVESDIDAPVYESLLLHEIKVGRKVVIKSLNSQAIIKHLPDSKNRVRVAIGNMETTVSVADLGKCELQKEKPKTKQNIVEKSKSTSEALIEIKVLGQTVSEAIESIEPLLESAYVSHSTMLKIIHGKGTGALSKGLHQYFKKHTLVSELRYGRYGEGDNGVTFLTIKY